MRGSNRRRYFTEAELGKLISAARKGRYGQRDATLVLLMARHGLRVSEAVDLEWDQIDFTRAHLHVRRLKGGIASVHPIQGDELRALREVQRRKTGSFVFASERGGPMTRSNVSKMIAGAGERAGLPYAHPHMLRHTCGHLLADAGHDTRRLQLWLGHADIKHTAHYSELSAKPFKDFGSKGATMQDATVMTAKELRQQLRLRCAIGTLAKQKAIRQIKKMIAAKGQRYQDYTMRELSLMAESYLDQHREELTALVRPLAEEILRKW